MSVHPTSNLNDVVHQRHRLGILTIAAESSQVEFGYLREALDLTGGNLSRHISVLAEDPDAPRWDRYEVAMHWAKDSA